MKQSPKYAIVNNNLQRVSPQRPDVSMFNLHTNNSFEVQSEMSVGSSYGVRSRSIQVPRREDPVIEDGKLMIRYLMACVELERMSRFCEKIKTVRYNQEQIMREFRAEHELLKASLHSKNKEMSLLNEDVVSLQQKIRYFEQALRQKERQLSHKDDEIRSTRLELTGMSLSHSRFQHNEKNRIKQLQAELTLERGRYNDLLRRKEEVDNELRTIAQRETALETTASVSQKRLLTLEDQTQNLRSACARLEAEHQQALSTAAAFSREKQQLLRKVEDYRARAERADELQKRLQQRDAEASELGKEAQKATGKAQTLERQLAAVQIELRTLRQSEGQTLRKQFASLQNRLSALSSAEKQSQGKGSQLQQLTRERDSLHAKVEQLISELSKLERSLATRDSDCRACARLSSENSLLSKKLGVLEQSLRQRESEVLRLSSRSTTVTNDPKNSGSKVSVKDLLLSAQQLKGSNQRMSRLIDSSSEYELRTVSKAVSHRMLSHRQ